MSTVPIRIINKAAEVENLTSLKTFPFAPSLQEDVGLDDEGCNTNNGSSNSSSSSSRSGIVTPPLKKGVNSLPPTPTSLNERFLKASTSFENIIHSGISGIKNGILFNSIPPNVEVENYLLKGLKLLKITFKEGAAIFDSFSSQKKKIAYFCSLFFILPVIWIVSLLPLMGFCFVIIYSLKFGPFTFLKHVKECIPKNNFIRKISDSYILPLIDYLIIVFCLYRAH